MNDDVMMSSWETREQVDVLVRQFHRFGLATSTELIELDAPARESVADARARLLELLEGDERIKDLSAVGPSDVEGLLLELVRLCVQGRLHHHLNEADVPYPVYNFFAGFHDNWEGPWDRMPSLPEATADPDWKVMGIATRMPVGVPASGLTANWRWVRYFARRGFNILTYKTVRSAARAPHRYPHWVFVEDGEPWESLDAVTDVVGDLETWPKDLRRSATANSFGIPSPHPDEWKADVQRALSELAPGQLLIVSVVGSSEEHVGSALIDDFVRTAVLAEETGAPAIELNLSCPNTIRSGEVGMGAPICIDPIATEQIVREVRQGLNGETKLVAKLSALPPATLDRVVEAIAGLVDGISGINTVQAPVRSHEGGSPFIGIDSDPTQVRSVAGVSGYRIRPLGLAFVDRVAELRRRGGHSYSILGMGGVATVGDVEEYARRGADVVQTATGACLYPQLPLAIAADGDPWHERPAPKPPKRTRRGGLHRVGRALSTGGLSLVLADERVR